MAIEQAKVLTITSVKGGVGKSTVTLNLAGTFKKMNRKVLIIDLDLYSGSIAASLNIDNEKDLFLLMDDMNNNRFSNINDYIVNYTENIDVIPSPKDPRQANKINSKYLQLILTKAKLIYDVILIDTNHILNEINLVTLDHSAEILYVITNDPIDLKNMRTMVSIYNDMNKKNYKIILNEATNKQKKYFSNYDIKNVIKHNVDYTIPSSFYIKNINGYILDGKILTLDNKFCKTHKKAVEHFNKIAMSLVKDKKSNARNFKI